MTPALASVGTLYRVLIDMTDGSQHVIRSDHVLDSSRGPVSFEQIPAVLTEPGGWVEWATAFTFDSGAEPWLPAETYACVVRVYARAVAYTTLVFSEAG